MTFSGDLEPFGGYYYDKRQLAVLDQLIEIARLKFEQCIRVKDPSFSRYPSNLPTLDLFIKQTIIESNTAIPNLVVALVYLHRFGLRIASKVNGAHDSRHRIFLACLVIACKYLNDVTYKNEYWASLWKTFSVEDVNLMERELLIILNFNLTIRPDDMDLVVGRYFKTDEVKWFQKTLFTHQPWFATAKA
jgi:hypothetical protein